MKRNVSRVIIAVFAVLLPLINACDTVFAVTGYNPPKTNIGSMQDLLEREAKAQVIMYALRHCVAGGVRNGKLDEGIDWSDEVSHGGDNGIFDTGDEIKIDIGYWLEKELAGESDDGRVYCGEGDPVQLAANILEIDREDILCDSNGKGGIVDIKEGKSGKCGDNLSYAYVRNGSPKNRTAGSSENRLKDWEDDYDIPWNAFLKNLYNGIAEKNDWQYRYDDLDLYYGMTGYFLYRLEINENCGGFDVLDSKPDDMDMVLIDVTQTGKEGGGEQAGKIVYKKYEKNNSFKHEFVARDDISTCKEMIARANYGETKDNSENVPSSFKGDPRALSEIYLDRMLTVLNKSCRADMDEKVKQAKENSEDGKLPEETQKAYDEAVKNTKNYDLGEFIEGDKEKGWVCKDIGDLEGGGQSDPTGVDPNEKKTEPDCYSNAGSLGWIMCPIIDQGGKFVTGLYEEFIEPFMILDSGLFNQSKEGASGNAGKAVYDAWTQFQNYANIAFIIVFLVVIFSQLTGYGIDNYGIKKILPKLIIAAVLINASYIICQLAIDVANIIGVGVKGIMDGIGKVDMATMSLSETGGQASGSATGATVILVGLIALLVAPILLSKGIAILVPIFIAIIGVVIAVFTLFCTLAVRKALAVVLVVISPLAFLCYMLPNTKKLFDRWLTAFKAVLLAFPICAGMVYGGQAVARIMVMASGGSNMPFLMVLSAAVMCVAPIFLIPGTLKKSMGAVTAAIDRVSRGASHRARGAARNSSISRDLERRGQMQRSGIKIGKDGKVQFTSRGKIQNRLPRTAASKRRIDAARADAIKGMSAESAAGSYMGAKGLERLNSSYSSGQAAIDKQRVSDLEASYKLGDQGVDVTDLRDGGSLQQALQAAIMDGDADKIKALSNIATSQGDKGRSVVKNAARHAEANAGTNAEAVKKLKAGKKALASNIMDNYAGSYKENARSTYDWATANQSDGGGRTMADAEAGVSTGSLRGSLLNSMDDADFELMANRKAELDQRISNGESLSGEQQADYDNIREAAYAAQHDQSFTGTKIERQKLVNDMVGDYKPKAVQEQEAAAAAQQDGAASKIATAIADEQQKREVNMYLSGMSQEERSALYHDNPARDGESMNEHIYRVAREHHENQQKNGK